MDVKSDAMIVIREKHDFRHHFLNISRSAGFLNLRGFTCGLFLYEEAVSGEAALS